MIPATDSGQPRGGKTASVSFEGEENDELLNQDDEEDRTSILTDHGRPRAASRRSQQKTDIRFEGKENDEFLNQDDEEDRTSISIGHDRPRPSIRRSQLSNLNPNPNLNFPQAHWASRATDPSTRALSEQAHDAAHATLPQFVDHYSLPAPSSSIRFRTGTVHVYEQQGSQMVVEEHVTMKTSDAAIGSDGEEESDDDDSSPSYDRVYTVKHASNTTFGLLFLRGLYSSLAIFLAGFAFIFSIGVLLFLVSDVGNQAREGLSSNDGESDSVLLFPFFGTLFSIPVFLNGCTSVMALLTRFAVDLFSGSPLLRSFGWGVLVNNWITFLAFSAAPAISFIAALMARSDNVWQITLITSFVSVNTYFTIFAGLVIYHRIAACIYLVEEMQGGRKMSLSAKVKCMIVISAQSRLQGVSHHLYVREFDDSDVKSRRTLPQISMETDDTKVVVLSRGQFYVRLTKLPFLSCFFETLEDPQRWWSQEEIDGNIPYYTRNSWSLDRTFCRNRKQSSVVVVGGPLALTREQTRSSLICYFMGVSIYLLILISICVWFGSAVIGTIVAIVFLLCWSHEIRRRMILSKRVNESLDAYKLKETDDGSNASTSQQAYVICQVWKSHVITRPTVAFAWFYVAIQVIVFFLYPFVYLCVAENLPGAVLFMLMFLIWFETQYLDAKPLIHEMGTYGSLGIKEKEMTRDSEEVASRNEWKSKSRLYQIGSIENSSSSKFWSNTFYMFLLLFTVVVASAATGTKIASDDSTTTKGATSERDKLDPWMTYPSGATFFYNEPQSLSHHQCHLGDGNIRLPGDPVETTPPAYPVQYLVDYAFLANIPYFKVKTLQPLLDTWFGPNQAFLEKDTISAFRKDFPEFAQNPAEFRLVSFSDKSAIVVVRGTKTHWDYLADARLWYSSALFQLLRVVLPIGHLFDPLIRFSIDIMAILETNSIKKTAYYHETTAFVNYLLASGIYTKVEITGHSLGGGLALITGAQTHIKGVGLSAPNTSLGRDTVSPTITLDELEKFSFNIVPERDIFPMIGDLPKNIERLACRANLQSSFSCHDAGRSVCEMLYSCGSVARPVHCECVSQYSYPEPVAIDGNGESFASACLSVEGL